VVARLNTSILGGRKARTANNITEDLGGVVRTEDVLHIVKTKMSAHITWHTAVGRFGTLLWPKSQNAVELLHKEWDIHEREVHRLRIEKEEIEKVAEKWREASKEPDLDSCTAEFNRLVREEVKRLRSAEYNGGEGKPSFDISKLDIVEEMEKFDPKLLDLLERVNRYA
jgi:hypothetical protein